MTEPVKGSGGSVDLVSDVAHRANVTKSQAARAIEALFSVTGGLITQTLKAGEELEIPGFGRIRAKPTDERAKHAGNAASLPVNPLTGFHVLKGIRLRLRTRPRRRAGLLRASPIAAEVDAMFAEMQTPAAHSGIMRAFHYTPAELGRAAVKAARAERAR